MFFKTGLILSALTLLIIGCGKSAFDNPIATSDPSQSSLSTYQTPSPQSNRHLWGFWNVQIDPATQTAVVSTERSADMHLNVTKLLETSCSDCLKIGNIKLTAPHELSVDVTLKHPYASDNLNLTGFDVRGIFITDGETQVAYSYWISLGDNLPRLINPDGYTEIFNPTDFPQSGKKPPILKYFHGKHASSDDLSANINPFLAFSQDKPRRMFLPGTQETRQMLLHVPTGPFKFGYAVDACWTPPLKKPVVDPESDFPITANCTEPYMISITVGESLDEWSGSSTQICVDIFSHHDPDSDFNIFDDYGWNGPTFDSTSFTETITPGGNLRTSWYIHNTYSTKPGDYPLFLYYKGYSYVDPNFYAVPAWQVTKVTVNPMGEHPPVVLADAYPKNEGVSNDIHFFDSGTTDPDGDNLVKYEWDLDDDGVYETLGKSIYHAYDTPGDYLVSLRVTDSDGQAGVLATPIPIHVKPGQGWARTWGADRADLSYAVTTDKQGYVYVGGYLHGLVDMDPGPGVDEHICWGNTAAFLSKFDSKGLYIWARTWPTTAVNPGGYTFSNVAGLTVDGSGNIYAAGGFNEECDFDPGPGTDIHTAEGNIGADAYLTKFDNNGNFKWARTWGGTNHDHAGGLAVDPSDNVIVSGYFSSDVVDFDPGPGEDIHSLVGGSDCFVSKFSPSGQFAWAQTWGGPPSDSIDEEIAYGAATDSLGSIYVGGRIHKSCDFDPGPGVDLQEGSMFMSKFDPNGVYQWARVWGYPGGSDTVYSVRSDGNDDLYLTGFYYHDTDFDPGPGTDIHSSDGQNAFLSKFDSSGIFKWARTWGEDTYAHSCAVDPNGDVFVTGDFGGGGDFDPGPGVINIDTKNGHCYLSKFNSQGDLAWVRTWGVWGITPHEESWGVASDLLGNAYVGGFFWETIDFDPGPEEDLRTSTEGYGSCDAFLTKFQGDGNW
jgi:hypothetical protein